MLDDKSIPQAVRFFLESNNIDSVSVENITASSDYMPDWAHVLVLMGSDKSYNLTMSYSEDFNDNYDYADHAQRDNDIYCSTEDDFLEINLSESSNNNKAIWSYLLTKVYVPNTLENFMTEISI